ncbi:MAG: TonB-dependent receptor [Mucilaginibacter sp.]|nr:TonB-dependent receptor [Mucilaginibacter sp.]
MLKLYPTLFLIFAAATTASAQTKTRDTTKTDSTRNLSVVTVKAYLSDQPILNIPASVSVITPAQLSLQSGSSMVPAMNTVPGVRMEERSPGSYRLAIRGSLIRSPFGVRDVKIYFDEIPLTDAGGNTYLAAVDVNSIYNIEILKGPDGSLFGANTSGVVLMNAINPNAGNFASLGMNGGSYGLYHENAAVQNQTGNNLLNINQSYERSDGYRQNSAMHKNYLQVEDRLKYAGNDQLKFLGFYSDLYYQTPGGLTLAQMEANPTDARLATKTSQSAQTLKAAVFDKTLFGGVVNEVHITNSLRNVTTVFGTHVDWTNPSFTTYEHRDENTFGLRTYFELASGAPQTDFNWKLNLGGEWQQTNSIASDYGNNHGNPDTTQTQDRIHTNQHFIFTRFEAHLYQKLQVEAALSLNNYDYQFLNIYPLKQTTFIKRPFNAELMPRLALSYQITNDFIWRASLSRGYSTPNTGEVRGTDHVINPTLQAQDGYNYETGFRLRDKDERFLLDASVFYYRLNNAIVQLEHPDGSTYYTNVGGTNQPGLEAYFTGWLIKQNTSQFIQGLQFNQSYTLSKFTFRDYQDATKNYSGNELTGVPRQAIVSSVLLLFPKGFYLFSQYSFTAKAPLNDANTIYSGSYNLLGGKAGWKSAIGKTQFEVFVGADNLLNTHYSLGDDLNAALNRFYNPAALRNYYGGFNVKF